MRRGTTIGAGLMAFVCTIGAATAFGQARNPTKPAKAAPSGTKVVADPAKMERLLQLWEKQSSLLKTLDAKIFRRDYIVDWDEYEYFEGRALFRKPNLAHIDLRKIQQDKHKKPVKDPQTDAWVSAPSSLEIYTGQEVRYYDFDTEKVIVFHSLDKDQAARAIDRFPMSFFFNIEVQVVKQRYGLTLIKEDDKSYGVSLVPRSGTSLSGFSKAFILLDRELMLPTRVVLHSPDGKSQKDFQFSAIKPNAAIEEGVFDGKAAPSWKESRFAADGLVGILRLW